MSALLALVIGSIVMAGQIQGQKTAATVRSASIQAGMMNNLKAAANQYAVENYLALQNTISVTKNGVTLAAGAAPGQAMSPTIENLVAMGYLPIGTSSASSMPEGNYRLQFEKLPAGCVSTSSVCNVTGVLYVDRPLLTQGTTEMNGPAIATVIEHVGADVLVSLNTDAGQLVSPSGATVTNPLGSNAGVIGARVGFGSMGFGNFLIVNDPRDPNFQGNVTVRETLTAETVIVKTSLGVGEGSSGCSLGEITSSGAFLSRTADCILRAWVDGSSGRIGVADAAGNIRAQLDGNDGSLTLRDAANTKTAGFSWTGGDSTVYADNLRNSAGSAGIRSDGTVYGDLGEFDTVVINNTAIIGSACPTQNAAVWGALAGAPVLLKCEGGLWVAATGTAIASVGQACTVPNQHGVSNTGVGLICQGGSWMQLSNRMGYWAFANAYLVSHGSVIPKPSCGTGGVARIYATPQAINSSKLYANYRASESASNWTMQVTDNTGAGLDGNAIAQTGCIY